MPFTISVFSDEIELNRKTEVLVLDRKDRLKRKNFQIHLCKLKLPRWVLTEINKKPVVAAEFMFVQLANELDRHQLIMLGHLLCSTPKGKKAITTKKQLIMRIKSLKGFRGYENAMVAAKYVEDACRSPLEAICHMLFSLPNYLGGLALGDAEFNKKIDFRPDVAAALGQPWCLADLFFRKYRLIIEYDSFANHNTAFQFGKDAERATALRRHAYYVINVVTSQIYKPLAFEQLVRHIASLTRKGFRIRTSKYYESLEKIRALLPTWDGVNECIAS